MKDSNSKGTLKIAQQSRSTFSFIQTKQKELKAKLPCEGANSGVFLAGVGC